MVMEKRVRWLSKPYEEFGLYSVDNEDPMNGVKQAETDQPWV